jgi:hypothetical protein
MDDIENFNTDKFCRTCRAFAASCWAFVVNVIDRSKTYQKRGITGEIFLIWRMDNAK